MGQLPLLEEKRKENIGLGFNKKIGMKKA